MMCVTALLVSGARASPGTGIARIDFTHRTDLTVLPDEEVIPKFYFAPSGFAGTRWGTPLTARPFGPMDLTFVSQADDRSFLRSHVARCAGLEQYSCVTGNAAEVRRPRRQEVNTSILAEYSAGTLRFFIADTSGWIERTYFDFCASMQGDFDERRARSALRFCGVRMMFRARAAGLDDEIVTDNETRVLRALTRAFGRPLEEPPSAPSSAAPIVRHRWCNPPTADGNPLTCTVSLTYAYDGLTGAGLVLFSTPAVNAHMTLRWNVNRAVLPIDQFHVLLFSGYWAQVIPPNLRICTSCEDVLPPPSRRERRLYGLQE